MMLLMLDSFRDPSISWGSHISINQQWRLALTENSLDDYILYLPACKMAHAGLRQAKKRKGSKARVRIGSDGCHKPCFASLHLFVDDAWSHSQPTATPYHASPSPPGNSATTVYIPERNHPRLDHQLRPPKAPKARHASS